MTFQTKRQRMEAEAELRTRPTRRSPMLSDTGITDDTRDDLNQIHQDATHLYMEVARNKSADEVGA